LQSIVRSHCSHTTLLLSQSEVHRLQLGFNLHQFAANNLLTNQRVDEHVAMDRVGTCMLHVSYMSHVSVVVEDDLPLVGRWSLGTV
jgi:hypothetical protein